MMRRTVATAVGLVVCGMLAAPAQAILLPKGKSKPANVFTLKLEARGLHSIKYGPGGDARTGAGTGTIGWSVTDSAPYAFPLEAAKGTAFSRVASASLKLSGTFTEQGTANFDGVPPPDSFSCRGGLIASSSTATNVSRTVGDDDLYRLFIPSFSAVSPGVGFSCSRPEAFPSYFANNMDEASQAELSLGQATLRESVVRVPVGKTRQGLPCASGSSALQPCRQGIFWNGTVTLEKACRNGSATYQGVAGDPGFSCVSPCKGAGCDKPVLGITPKEIINIRGGNNVKVEVRCLGGAACRGRSKVYEVKARGSSAARRRRPVLAQGSFRLRAGTRKTIKLRMTRAGRRRFTRRRTRRVRIDFRLSGRSVGERSTSLRTKVRRRR